MSFLWPYPLSVFVTHLLTRSLTDSRIYSLAHSLTHSLTHSITHSLTHSLTNSPTLLHSTLSSLPQHTRAFSSSWFSFLASPSCIGQTTSRQRASAEAIHGGTGTTNTCLVRTNTLARVCPVLLFCSSFSHSCAPTSLMLMTTLLVTNPSNPRLCHAHSQVVVLSELQQHGRMLGRQSSSGSTGSTAASEAKSGGEPLANPAASSIAAAAAAAAGSSGRAQVRRQR
jgi:hypothetical protein